MAQWKQKQRTYLLEKRTALSAEVREEMQTSVLAYLKRYLASEKPTILGIYWPIKGELDCRHLAEWLIGEGWQLAVPVINEKTKGLDFALWQPNTEMTKGIWNIPIPINPEWVKPEQFLIPLVGFDAQNYRLGYGGGYYDRTLAGTDKPVKKIGIGIELGRLKTIYPHEFDVAMDMIITEQGLSFGEN